MKRKFIMFAIPFVLISCGKPKILNEEQRLTTIRQLANARPYRPNIFRATINEESDIDIVVEGDGIAFAKKIADIIGAEVISHDRFGTAKCKLKSGLRLDISTARMEYYDFPAALPIVERSSLREDLFRRDFTINAMAIQLNRLKYGQLIDYFQGYEDLQQRKIRVLYNLSFVEDPTRILRAIRFEQRFAFRMEEQTLEFVRHSAELIASVSASRLTVELKLIFEETNPVASIKRLQELEVIEYITGNGKKININEIYELDRILNNGKAKLFWASYIATLFYETTDWFEKALRFCPIKSEREVLLDILKLADRTDYKSLAKNTNSLSQIHRYLKNISTEAIAFYIATVIADELVKKKFLKYLLQRDTLVIPLKGGDLKKLGLRPGPIYKRIFEKLEELVLDERITNKEEALEWLKQLSL